MHDKFGLTFTVDEDGWPEAVGTGWRSVHLGDFLGYFDVNQIDEDLLGPIGELVRGGRASFEIQFNVTVLRATSERYDFRVRFPDYDQSEFEGPVDDIVQLLSAWREHRRAHPIDD